MTKYPKIAMWMGEPIDDLPREKLLEIIHHLGGELEDARNSHAHTLSIWSAAAQARARAH